MTNVVCEINGTEHPVDEMVLFTNDRYVHKVIAEQYAECEICSCLLHDSEQIYGPDQEIYCDECFNDSFFHCDDCNGICHNEDGYVIDQTNAHVCNRCYENSYFYCEGCNQYMHNDEYSRDGLCYECDEEPQICDKDGKYKETSLEIELPKQSIETINVEVQEYLDKFYQNRYRYYPMNHWKDISRIYKQEIELSVEPIRRLMNSKITNPSLAGSEFVTKYTTVDVISTDGVNVTYEYVDSYGNKKIKKEKINSVYEYFKSLYGEVTTKDLFNRDGPSKNNNFTFKMSNDIRHKLKLAKENNRAFHSCQTSDNSMSYAHGMHDRFSNGCNIPVAIYKGENIVGRILVRLFLDKEESEYMFIDRLYLSNNYSNYRYELIIKLAEELNKERPLAVAIRSEHDKTPLYDILTTKISDQKFTTPEGSLRQPQRKYGDVMCGYYHDSYTRTRYNESTDMVYDRIRSYNYKILPKNSFN